MGKILLVSILKILPYKVHCPIKGKCLIKVSYCYYQNKKLSRSHSKKAKAFRTEIDSRLHWNYFGINMLGPDLELIDVAAMNILNIT